jgi:hypothetical protein
MSRTILIALAVAAVAIVIGVLAWREFGGGPASAGTPRIAIVTDQLLEAAAQAGDREAQSQALFATIQQNGRSMLDEETPARGASPSRDGDAATPEMPSANGAAAQAGFLRDALSDELEAQINKMLTGSQRFAVMDPSSVRSAVSAMASDSAAPQDGQEPKSRTVAEEGIEKGKELISGLAQGSSSSSGAGGATVTQVVSVTDRLERGDWADAARRLRADYMLAAFLREPRVTYEYVVNDSTLTLRLESDPVFVYRLYSVRGMRTVISDATQLGAPVVVEAPIPIEYWRNPMVQSNFATEVAKAMRELSNKVQERVARHIADAVLDATFPAVLTSASPLVMNRGSNDGFAEGDEVAITRAGEEIRDGDIVIDREESPVGTARVTSVKGNSARLEPTSGEGFARNDIVRRSGSGGGGAVSGGAGGGRGLGREDILANRANGAAIRERVAVSSIRIVRDDSRIFGPGLQMDRAIAERLARDPRIEVMSRESLNALASERAVGGARKTYERGGGGVGQAGYLVLGDVTVDVRRNVQYIEVPGAQKREVSASTSMIANGSLRIERLDSRLIDSFQVTASVPIGAGSAGDAEAARKVSEAFADAAARAILPRLFPMEVVAVQGGSIVLNRGDDVGIKVGDTYAIYTLGEPIIDSTTGAQIAEGVRRQVATVRIQDVQRNVSVASPVGDGAQIQKGQIAEPTQTRAPAASAGQRSGASRPPAEKKSDEMVVPF